jgi:hypothetical protein
MGWPSTEQEVRDYAKRLGLHVASEGTSRRRLRVFPNARQFFQPGWLYESRRARDVGLWLLGFEAALDTVHGKMLMTAPLALRDATDRMYPADRENAAHDLDVLSARAGFYAAYMKARHGGLSGDEGHEDAARQAFFTEEAVRKVLGFSYPGVAVPKI